MSGYDGVEISVVTERSDGKRYVMTVKDQVPAKREDGREGSGVTWEWDFVVKEGGEGGGEEIDGAKRITVDWDAFKPTFRGRVLKRGDVKPLDLGNVKRVGIMMRSFFAEQEGEFALCLESIAVVKHGPQAIRTE